MFRKLSSTMALVFVVGTVGCLGSAPKQNGPTGGPTSGDPTASGGPTVGNSDPTGTSQDTSGGTNNTFDHMNDGADPFQVLARIQAEGPPEVSSRMHSCQKMKYATLGTVLTQLGVSLTKTATPPAAGQLYKAGAQAMGAPNYAARIREAIELSTAGATKLFDIFVQAALEVIAAMPTLTQCQKAGAATQMFDAQGKCTMDGITCLKGAPATADEVALCNQVLTEASSATIGKTIAVASILASAHTCE